MQEIKVFSETFWYDYYVKKKIPIFHVKKSGFVSCEKKIWFGGGGGGGCHSTLPKS